MSKRVKCVPARRLVMYISRPMLTLPSPQLRNFNHLLLLPVQCVVSLPVLRDFTTIILLNCASGNSGPSPTITIMPATTAETLSLVSRQVSVAPLVLLSAADHYGRSAKGTRKRVVGVLLGQNDGKNVRVSNSFAGTQCFQQP